MTTMRWIGLAVGIIAVIVFFFRFRQGRLRRLDFFLAMLFGASLVTVSLYPNSVNLLRDMLSLKADQFSRLIAIIIVSNLLLWFVVFYTRMGNQSQLIQFDRLIRKLGMNEFERDYGQKALPPVLVVIPAYNEAENIVHVLEAMPKKVCGKDLTALVVDDGSSDGTADAVRSVGFPVVQTPINRGGGAALRLGFDIAARGGAEMVVTMDADGQHLPAEIERLVAPVVQEEMDFVIGSRILGEREKDSAVRYLGIHLFNTVIRVLTNVKITDCSNGFRCLRVSQLSRIRLAQDQYHTSELIIEAAKKGIRIGEAPVTVKRRLSGESKKGRNWLYGLKFGRTVLKTWWR